MKPQTKLFITVLLLIATLSTQAQSWMSGGPYLQELTENGVTVVFKHDLPSVSWIEVREKGSSDSKSFYEVVDGKIKAYRQVATPSPSCPIQSFAVRATGLKPATTYEYRVRARQITTQNANGVNLGISISNNYTGPWYEFKTEDPNNSEHHIFVTSDMHNHPDSLAALLRQLDYKTCDHFIYDGDMEDYMQLLDVNTIEEPFSAFINTSVNYFAKNKPFEIVRGNHETRGDISRHFSDYFPHTSGNIYNFYRWGDLAVVCLDSGEDKVDDHAEYYGMAAYYPYREIQAEWMKRIIETEEFKTAKYRLFICHFRNMASPTRNNEFDGEPHYEELFYPLVQKGNFDLAISGHAHPKTYTYYDKNYKTYGNNFEEYTNGAQRGIRIDIANGNIHIKIMSAQGDVFLDKTVKDSKSRKKLVYITTE